MFDPLIRRVLALLKVPPEPHPPMGDPASLRVFRAGRNYLRLRLGVWAVAQVLALAGIIFWTIILIGVERNVHERNAAPITPPTPTAAPGDAAPSQATTGGSSDESQKKKHFPDRFAEAINSIAKAGEQASRNAQSSNKVEGWIAAYQPMLTEVALHLPERAFPLLWILKVVGIAVYLIQLPLTYAVRRLDYEMRWYMVTDRSLRLRHGVWKVSESTMSFANVQQVDVSQGPLQRLLGLANVKVKSAGGGTGHEGKSESDDMHTGLFHSVTNASEIRDLILERLRRFREAGLGDPDEKPAAQTSFNPSASSPDVALAAVARDLLTEAKALRETVS
jgi:membrane protein YdbS with pleckstrin-like domain